ncbi:cation:proton antiporter [Sphingomicrobium aestuariivivum]|uniref:cation:proton antiporter n=1 Tax=Sphingomicrobium aestuariivivum TaxID=1582356 RepID=UPI001FD6EF57|nr:cation:proton antiporter [Sphingomicrobium aestuariivivum]MCJ8191321.1 cation:proton antiporter [Sphingomicrobium aestuariivivum]
MSEPTAFLLAMLAIYTLPWLLWRALGRRSWAPLVVVQIVGGVLAGPALLGAVVPSVHEAVFTPSVLGALGGIASWAVMLFVFVAGLELDLPDAWAKRRDTGTTAGLALLVPFLLGAGAAMLVMRDALWMGEGAERWQFLLGIGLACSVTALPILLLFLEKLEILRSALGQRILRYASLDDLVVWALLALILVDAEMLGRQAVFALAFAAATFLARKLFARAGGKDRVPLALMWLILVALGADWAGLHYMVGAFLAGAVLEASWFGITAIDEWRDRILTLLMPVFFLSTGLRTRWEMGGMDVILVALALLVAAVAGKRLGVALAGRMLGWAKGEARLVGWLLQTKALIMIIFANILLDRQVISSTAFTALLLMAVLSTMLAMPMAARALGKARAA